MFQVKVGCESKLAADDNNANLILIWPYHHFQQNAVSFCQKYVIFMLFLLNNCY